MRKLTLLLIMCISLVGCFGGKPITVKRVFDSITDKPESFGMSDIHHANMDCKEVIRHNIDYVRETYGVEPFVIINWMRWKSVPPWEKHKGFFKEKRLINMGHGQVAMHYKGKEYYFAYDWELKDVLDIPHFEGGVGKRFTIARYEQIKNFPAGYIINELKDDGIPQLPMGKTDNNSWMTITGGPGHSLSGSGGMPLQLHEVNRKKPSIRQ